MKKISENLKADSYTWVDENEEPIQDVHELLFYGSTFTNHEDHVSVRLSGKTARDLIKYIEQQLEG